MKGGDTVFAVRGAEVRGGDWFVPASLAAELRREGLDALSKARSERGIGHRILPEGRAEYPAECLSAEENVTNRLAEAFYRDHGVGRIERGAGSRGFDGGAPRDAFGLLHPPRDRRMSP